MRPFRMFDRALLNDESCYLEVGKNNVWSVARMASAPARSPFRLVAVDYQGADWMMGRLLELTRRVEVGEMHALSLTVFPFETLEMIRAFNELRRGDHIGKWLSSVC